MKPFVRSVLFSGALALGASGLMAAQPDHSGMEQWFKAKYGRPSPMVEARLKDELANTAFREETPGPITQVAPNWTEQYFRAKFGRNTPAEEARLKAERDSTAFREELTTDRTPARSLRDERYRAKYGHLPGR